MKISEMPGSSQPDAAPTHEVIAEVVLEPGGGIRTHSAPRELLAPY